MFIQLLIIVGDSTAKVVNSEQITTVQKDSIIGRRVGDSTAKVVNSEQITTCIEMGVSTTPLVILPQR